MMRKQFERFVCTFVANLLDGVISRQIENNISVLRNVFTCCTINRATQLIYYRTFISHYFLICD